MKIKTSELTSAALDWAVAKCEGFESFEFWHTGAITTRQENGLTIIHRYSTDWAQGGPIIERERLSTNYSGYKGRPWYATHPNAGRKAQMDGTTPLIAAMRCLIASKLGDEVDVPKELVCTS